MIVGDIKPIEEIARSLAGYSRVHLLGCGGCVTVCRSGGDAETRELASTLSHPRYHEGPVPTLTTATFERQCELDLMQSYLEIPEDAEVILSLACGVGVQILADLISPRPVVPALSTTFMGGADEPGVWKEKCRGCGDCVLALTASICPITRCAKSLLNGPCGGSADGMCEVGTDTPCAWAQIIERLTAQGRLELLTHNHPPRDWTNSGAGGVRERRRTGVAPSPNER